MYCCFTLIEEFVLSWDELYCFLLIEVRLLCCHSLCHNCFHVAMIFTFFADQVFPQRWKQSIVIP